MHVEQFSMLCLGDSYTIGESVNEEERFPNQCIRLLAHEGIFFEPPTIIAKTGWTTDELIKAIQEQKPQGTYHCVTLLIGVNNQYRGYDTAIYRKEFTELLLSAIDYAGKNSAHVFVVSIPDYGVTPFGRNDAKGRTPEQIGMEIDLYNAMAREISAGYAVHFIDVNPVSKKALHEAELIANDNLHPSGKMYALWSAIISAEMKKVYGK